MAKQIPIASTRPMPPIDLGQVVPDGESPKALVPAPDIRSWVINTILADDGALHNPDHKHLLNANLCFLWGASSFAKAGRKVLGQAEQVMFRVGGWQKQRQEQQMIEWFGHVPDFLITLAADYCAQCTDAEFCALLEHELYHIAHELDDFGAPKFTQYGAPKLRIVAHDVEEFIGVVRRYGPSADVARLVDAAKAMPEVGRLNISRACGCCLKVA